MMATTITESGECYFFFASLFSVSAGADRKNPLNRQHIYCNHLHTLFGESAVETREIIASTRNWIAIESARFNVVTYLTKARKLTFIGECKRSVCFILCYWCIWIYYFRNLMNSSITKASIWNAKWIILESEMAASSSLGAHEGANYDVISEHLKEECWLPAHCLLGVIYSALNWCQRDSNIAGAHSKKSISFSFAPLIICQVIALFHKRDFALKVTHSRQSKQSQPSISVRARNINDLSEMFCEWFLCRAKRKFDAAKQPWLKCRIHWNDSTLPTN